MQEAPVKAPGGKYKRKSMGRKTRFEVFKRDSFKCQYCGSQSPEVRLVVDHIKPVAEGGGDELLNLITSCWECNSGKGARELSDDTVVRKQVDQLAELQDRKEQLEMLLEWREGLQDIRDRAEEAIQQRFEARTGYSLRPHIMNKLASQVKKAGLSFVLDTIDTCCDNTLLYETDSDRPTLESVEAALKKIKGYISVEIRQKTDPHIKEIRYCVGILRNRFGADKMNWQNQKTAEDWLRLALEYDATSEALRRTAATASSFYSWTYKMEELVDKL